MFRVVLISVNGEVGERRRASTLEHLAETTPQSVQIEKYISDIDTVDRRRGCGNAHKAVASSIGPSTVPTVILEDDIRFLSVEAGRDWWTRILPTAIEHSNEIDLLLGGISATQPPCLSRTEPVIEVPGTPYKLYPIVGAASGFFCYSLLTENAKKQFCDLNTSTGDIDCMYLNKTREKNRLVKAYVVEPTVATVSDGMSVVKNAECSHSGIVKITANALSRFAMHLNIYLEEENRKKLVKKYY